MTNLYKSLLTGTLILAGAMSAQAYNLTINVNDASLVRCAVAYQDVELKNGVNEFKDLTADAMVQISPNDGAAIVSYSKNGVVTSWPSNIWDYLYSDTDYVIDINAGLIDNLASAVLNVKTDDADAAGLQLGPAWINGISTTLKTGDNVIKYIPGAYTYATISSNTYGKPLYKVTADGVEKTPDSGGQYQLTIEDGMNIEIQSKFPDIDVPVVFNYVNDGKDALEKVEINGTPVTNYNDAGFTVKMGDQLRIWFNTQDFKINKFDFNDTSLTWVSSYYDAYVTTASEITVDATKYAMYTFTVDVDDATHVEFWKGYSGSGTTVQLQNGLNTVEISSNNPRITVCSADGYLIDEMTVNGQLAEKAYNNKDWLWDNIADGDKVVIKTSVIVRDQTFALWLEDRNAWNDFNLTDPSWAPVFSTISTGYNVATRAEWEINPLYLSGWGEGLDYSKLTVYLDDNKLDWGSYGFNVTLRDIVDGNVIKVYTSGEPTPCNVDFDINENATGLFTVTKDVINTVDPEYGFNCLSGTQVTITSQTPLVVKVNGTAIDKTENVTREAADDNVYSFVVNDNSTVSIEKDVNVGIGTIAADAAETEIYNLQGVRVTNANLPAGIYIVNGKKVVVK